MSIFRLAKAASIMGVALFMVSACVSAVPITYNTNDAGSVFTQSGTTVLYSSDNLSTLSFVGEASSLIGTPSNISLGTFTLACPTCTPMGVNAVGAFYDPFEFNLIVTSETDNAQGTFVGSSTGGWVYSTTSQITVNWAPLVLGPGTNGADPLYGDGDFDGTKFSTTVFTGIVAPSTNGGASTVQGYVESSAIPEPSTLGLLGVALLGLGFLRRKGIARM